MSAHEWKVGDKATVEGVHVTTIARVGKRVKTADGSEWHTRSWSPGMWSKYGKGYGTLLPYKMGDEERCKIRELDKALGNAEQASRWRVARAESLEAEARKVRAEAAPFVAERDRIDGEIAALKAKLAQMEQP